MLRCLAVLLAVPFALSCHAILPLDTAHPAEKEASVVDLISADQPESDLASDLAVPDALVGPTTGPLDCLNGAHIMPSFSKTCDTDADCVAVTRQVDCCGTLEAIGINVQQQTSFEEEAKKCAAVYPGCKCATGPTKTDDGSTAYYLTNDFGATCVNGTCFSHTAECGQPCLGGLVCRMCMIAVGKYYGECSTACTVTADCPVQQPHCTSSGVPTKFCAAVAPNCM